MVLTLILTAGLLASAGCVGLAGLMLLMNQARLQRLTAFLIPYAIGTLLGAAFFGMLPYALAEAPAHTVLPATMGGLVLFFVLEKVALWRHCHEQDCTVHTRAGEMILLGDAIHNFVDGVAIAVAFAGSIPLGLATALAIIAHEVPQEVGDFVILLQSGYSRRRALIWNMLSGMATLPGALLAYAFLPRLTHAVPYLMALSAASFIYIALADLVPGRREIRGLKNLLLELVLMSLGVATILLFHTFRH